MMPVHIKLKNFAATLLSFTFYIYCTASWKHSLFSLLFCSLHGDTLEDIKQQKSKEDMFYIILFIRTLLTGK